MSLIIAFLAVGIAIGFSIQKFDSLSKINASLLNLTIYSMLLLLGIGAGSNEKVIRNLDHIGSQAIIITIGAIAGSIAMCWLLSKLIFKAK
ncbi:MAG: LysO family transporter [Bacteroidia bacterium]|nr:LysO family transporter [Bacteroidia bacterium]